MKNKKTAFNSIAWRLCIAMLLLWFICMLFTTDAVAQSIFQAMIRENYMLADKIADSSGLTSFFWTAQIKNNYCVQRKEQLDWCMMNAVVGADTLQMVEKEADSSWKILDDLKIPFRGAAVIYDPNGKIVMKSQDMLRFRVVGKGDWDGEPDLSTGYGWFNLEENPELAAYIDSIPGSTAKSDREATLPFSLYVTGYYDGGQLIPVKLEYANVTMNEILEGNVQWTTLFDKRGETEHTLGFYYATDISRYAFQEDPEELLSFEGVGLVTKREYRYQRMVLIDAVSLRTKVSSEQYGNYRLYVVRVCEPLKAAASNLKYIYIFTFTSCVLFTLFLLQCIRRNLTKPLEVLSARTVGEYITPLLLGSTWKEVITLENSVDRMEDEISNCKEMIRRKENEINRLKQSLSYARQAEENRRSMISAVAHELKTPLAVIHGYTEGLQENIAEEKKDQYLDTILSESERMDELVMEMLDLSRLEAGRVTLSRDTFSLTELIQSVFDRLARETEKKSLRLAFDLRCEGDIHGDEGRVQQVILNLASNAVRYTPAGGQIRVRTERKLGGVYFYMENDAAAFTEEELTKVWDTFYRTDRARHGKGTGLGLAIVKNIIKLHGGSCAVRNTQSGVEFSFRIPQIHG